MTAACFCYDCGLDYGEFPCDMLIQNELWERITPSEHRTGGILCPMCICRRLIALGLTCVRVTVDTAELLPEASHQLMANVTDYEEQQIEGEPFILAPEDVPPVPPMEPALLEPK